MMSGAYMGYMLIAGLMSMIGMYVSNQLKRKFSQYSQVPISSGKTGREIAEDMLRSYGIADVKVVRAKGFLSDHYNPMKKTIALSDHVYAGRSVASAAVAAHECGHAVQHAQSYFPLQLRSGIVPLVKAASMAQQWLLMIVLGGFGAGMSGSNALLLITIVVFGITTFFSLVTLPVEFDASNRALVWLTESGEATGQEFEGAKDALRWAAMTYVAAALSALVMLLYLVARLSSSRN